MDATDDAARVVPPPYLAGPLRLHPFRARLLQPSRIGDPASGRLFARPYRSVAARLSLWQERGWITSDPHPAVYLHEYTSGGHTVRGLVGALDLTRRADIPAESAVLPHEGIHPGQAHDLAARMEEMQLNPAPILLVHRGSDELREVIEEVAVAPPTRQFEDAGAQRHRLWAIRVPDALTAIAEELGRTRALIGDGHHRYAAYLDMQARRPGTAADAGLAMLIDQRDTPLQLRAIHRTLTGVRLDDVLHALERAGATVEFRPMMTVGALEQGTLAATDGHRWGLASLPSDGAAVEFVHDSLLPELSHGSARGPSGTPARVGHHTDADEAVRAAQRRRGTALLLPAPAVDQVLGVTQAGRLFPEKATSFQPKPHLGVLMRSLRDE